MFTMETVHNTASMKIQGKPCYFSVIKMVMSEQAIKYFIYNHTVLIY